MNIDLDEIKSLYETVECVWPKDDNWHLYSKHFIEKKLQSFNWNESHYVLNAGSGCNNYGLNSVRMHHRDIARNKVDSFLDYSVGTIEQLPMNQSTFDSVICVGSVINYCDALQTLSEFKRVLKDNGILYLEFESSFGFEHRKKTYYKDSAAIVNLKYFNGYWQQWIYSPDYIKKILLTLGFRVVKDYRFHILSALSFSRNENENRAAKYAKFDKLICKTPLAKHSNNVFLKCIKL